MQETYLPEHVKAVLSNVYPLLQAVSHLVAPFVEQPLALVHCGSHTEVNKQFCFVMEFLSSNLGLFNVSWFTFLPTILNIYIF